MSAPSVRAGAPRPSTEAATPRCRPAAGPPLSAHAASHASSQRRTSIRFSIRVPTTEYISAVKRAPVPLAEPNDRRPSDGRPPEQPLGETVVERHPGTAGEHAEPLAVVDERA